MKTRFFSKTMLLAVCAGAAVFFASCDKDDDNDNMNRMYTITGDASGAQEVPAVSTSATGTMTGTYNANTNQLQYSISWSGLSDNVTMAHFHGPASPGESAAPIIDLNVTANGTTGNITGTATLPDSTETHLLNGKLYYNLHTAANPNGEIRGQVTAAEQ